MKKKGAWKGPIFGVKGLCVRGDVARWKVGPKPVLTAARRIKMCVRTSFGDYLV